MFDNWGICSSALLVAAPIRGVSSASEFPWLVIGIYALARTNTIVSVSTLKVSIDDTQGEHQGPYFLYLTKSTMRVKHLPRKLINCLLARVGSLDVRTQTEYDPCM